MKFVQSDNIDQVKKDYPGAEEIVEVEGGYMVFDTVYEYENWMKQE